MSKKRKQLISVFVTFGQMHRHELRLPYNPTEPLIVDKDCLVEFPDVADHDEARKRAFQLFGDKFFTTYEEQPDMHYFPRGIVQITQEMLTEKSSLDKRHLAARHRVAIEAMKDQLVIFLIHQLGGALEVTKADLESMKDKTLQMGVRDSKGSFVFRVKDNG